MNNDVTGITMTITTRTVHSTHTHTERSYKETNNYYYNNNYYYYYNNNVHNYTCMCMWEGQCIIRRDGF